MTKHHNHKPDVPVVKDEDQEQPVASGWRPVFEAIVRAFVSGDYSLRRRVPCVDVIDEYTADHIESYIAAYGETLVDLPEDTWGTSVSQWMGSYWEVFVDLWTKESGCSDMVLNIRVYERGSTYRFVIHLVYVP
ncbi:MAG: hypothetical protein ACE366_22030 [Bradymonadia bacterium]